MRAMAGPGIAVAVCHECIDFRNQLELCRRQLNPLRHKKSLHLEIASRHSLSQLFIQDSLMKSVLVDHLNP
jgi:hypothetical protein